MQSSVIQAAELEIERLLIGMNIWGMCFVVSTRSTESNASTAKQYSNG